MTKDEALRLALEALENSVDLVVEDAYNAEKLYGNYPTRQSKISGLKILADQHKEAITAIQEALTQPEQEPIGYLSVGGAERLVTKKQTHEQIRNFRLFANDVFVYTTPPRRTWVGLTDDEIEHVRNDQPWWAIRDIEAKLKEKNT
jgi:hypothetical protein